MPPRTPELPRREYPVAGMRCRIETPCDSGGVPHSWVLGQLWSQTVVHLPPGDLGRLRPYSDRVGCRSAGSGAYLIRPARADGPKSSAHSHAELGSLSSSSLLSPCRAECRQGVELQTHGWRSISATAKTSSTFTRVEHRGFEPRTLACQRCGTPCAWCSRGIQDPQVGSCSVHTPTLGQPSPEIVVSLAIWPRS
jgi:hypothetical protein